MESVAAFEQFMSRIQLPSSEVQNLRTSFEEVRQGLLEDDRLKKAIHTIFLQGSYRRKTAIARHNGKKTDVDLVVVTKLDKREYTPEDALGTFDPFLEEHYPDQYEPQGRSIAIDLGVAKLDLVPTSQPGKTELGILKHRVITANEFDESIAANVMRKMWLEADDGFGEPAPSFDKISPLEIPDRDVKRWEPTHPLAQIRWTQIKNARCNGHYVPVVKAVKWWLRHNYERPKYPKGYVVEHIVGDCCPDGIRSVPEGVVRTLEQIAERYENVVSMGGTPISNDRGVNQNVLKRLTPQDFAIFHKRAKDAAVIARQALNAKTAQETADLWRTLLGDKYPNAPTGARNSDSQSERGGRRSGGFSHPTSPARPPDRRFA